MDAFLLKFYVFPALLHFGSSIYLWGLQFVVNKNGLTGHIADNVVRQLIKGYVALSLL